VRRTTSLMLVTALVGIGLPLAAAELVDSVAYRAVLRRVVRTGGIDYTELATHRMHLDRYLEEMATADLDSGTPAERTALWINAYNAGTLRLLLDRYPLRRSSPLGYLYPENSIRQVADAWDRVQLRVGGRSFSLNEVARQAVGRGQEPLVYFALASGARGAPRLSAEPYVGKRLKAQLEKAARVYLDNPEHGFHIDAPGSRVSLSRLFLWHGRDFLTGYSEGPLSGTARFSEIEAAVLHFIRERRPPDQRAYLEEGAYSLRYLAHDWMLSGW